MMELCLCLGCVGVVGEEMRRGKPLTRVNELATNRVPTEGLR